ncbi:hypothetical protein EUTSA_v10017987mg [Eutrema salsugineum]|uniref:No apical meristem-associated C-terminal domain-containing protein n=1 Tax=Eutrema salsugineum TaxID=72664 RepID=V4M567_EUTSA|nr:hypothetical protein EUTSA_v10017987mg [Eutrema salsugineum]
MLGKSSRMIRSGVIFQQVKQKETQNEEDGSQSTSSMADEAKTCEEENGSKRPLGVKASKVKAKKSSVETKFPLVEFETMWQIKEKDLTMKKQLSKMAILESLLAKKEPLEDYEEALKKKLITEMLD